MGAKTGIEWTDATWNPIIGCSRVSEGCRNCYAEAIAGRFGRTKDGKKTTVYDDLTQIVNGRAVWTGQIKETQQLLQPQAWKRPRRIFVNSMSDLFHENVTDEMRDRIFAVMALCPQHVFQVLTKRPERMLEYLSNPDCEARVARACVVDGSPIGDGFFSRGDNPELVQVYWKHCVLFYAEDDSEVADEDDYDWKAADFGWPLSNVWLGVSVENQKAADERVPLLLQTPAAVRFVSCEPLLGPVRIDRICDEPEGHLNALAAVMCCDGRGTKSITGVDWVICGGESGPGARPMHPDWARSLRDRCAAAGVPFFFKQWGEHWPISQMPDGWLDKEENQKYIGKGQVLQLDGSIEFAFPPGAMTCYPVGKAIAGAVLDGREWKEFPEAK